MICYHFQSYRNLTITIPTHLSKRDSGSHQDQVYNSHFEGTYNMSM
ncbi:hypothetical protein M8C21_021438 [Ambrosia artemisiifolia]|uniref:Uncharacterized protein n=1 Tax=Ambrosia artemisiifolia TaxID=4212 RepID=A0AAD5GSD1_AMBAR|nr:hypothetical protein M8C21_021438 [Ambrosia artemisiifolia]